MSLMAEYIYCRDAFPAVLCLQLYRTEHSNVAPVIRSVIGKTIYWLPFWIGLITMTEKAADTDMCIYLEINAHMCQIMYRVAF